MVIEIPDKILLKKNAESEIRLAVAIALFQNGILAVEPAARLGGVSVDTFRKTLAERDKIPSQLPEPEEISENGDVIFQHLAKPPKKGFDFEQIIKEQRYPGANKARVEQIIRELDIREPLDEMLATLTK